MFIAAALCTLLAFIFGSAAALANLDTSAQNDKFVYCFLVIAVALETSSIVLGVSALS